MRAMKNTTHIEGLLYQHSLTLKTSGENSKNPGTQYISGTLDIATDDALTNIVSIHFTYVTATTAKGSANATYNTLNDIINGTLKSVTEHGMDVASKLRVDSAIGLNEFYSDRNGEEELVSVKRNEGGFVHTAPSLNADENTRNTFECDMLIVGARRLEADDERNMPERVIVSGYIFDFRKALLPVEFTALSTGAMNYYEDLEASTSNPVLTKVWGRQVSQTIVRKITQESAFDGPSVREVTSTRRDFVITGGAKEPYIWDDESTMTVAELKAGLADRETYLATIRQRQADYRASQSGNTTSAPATTVGGFNF